MFEFTFRNVKIRFHFGFFSTVAILLVSSNSLYTQFAFYSCVLHEMGHLLAMILLDEPISMLEFCGTGIKLTQKRSETMVNIASEFGILSAGCLVNFTLFLAFFLNNSFMFAMFGTTNLLIGLFNLLPFSFLDGGKIVKLIYFRILSYENAVKVEHFTDTFFVFAIPIALLVLFFTGFGNFTLYFTLIYLLISTVIL